jgi:hypothetical protein
MLSTTIWSSLGIDRGSPVFERPGTEFHKTHNKGRDSMRFRREIATVRHPPVGALLHRRPS